MVLAFLMVMLSRCLLFLFISFSGPAFAKGPCSGDVSRHRAQAGFCITISSPDVKVTRAEIEALEKVIISFNTQFPELMKKVRGNGYQQISLYPVKPASEGGTAIAEVLPQTKQILIYQDYFMMTVAKKPELAKLPFPQDQMFLFHEFLHAFDDDFALVKQSLRLLGWDHVLIAPAGYRVERFKSIANTWITEAEAAEILKLIPELKKQGALKGYMVLREKFKKFGYPTMYSVVEGPHETFAELGAYIALDPQAESYIPAETVRWFRQNVLK